MRSWWVSGGVEEAEEGAAVQQEIRVTDSGNK